MAICDLLHTAQIKRQADPCSLPKARKNETEIAGARAAHKRDARAMVQFLAWLDATAPDGGLTEIDVVRKLEGFRRDTGMLRDIAFETISGAGPHGAPGDLLLVDSGGQYQDGTTDITRTISIGTPDTEQRTCYTQVLRGMIAVSLARFPKGVGGQHLDRAWCW